MRNALVFHIIGRFLELYCRLLSKFISFPFSLIFIEKIPQLSLSFLLLLISFSTYPVSMSNNSGNWNSMIYFCYPAHVEVSYEWDENERLLGPGQKICF